MSRECKLGYTRTELEERLGSDRLARFDVWMRGQTIAICDGLIYSHEARAYMASNCGPHGAVVYSHDLERFLLGQLVVD